MNNKKIIKTLVFSILIVAMLLSLASCGLFGGGNSNNNGNNSGGTVTISIYDATGFTAQDFVNTTTSTFKIPTKTPEKTGYDFEGWYFDDQFQNKLTAGKTVEPKTYTIYAHYVISTLSIKIIDEFNGNQTISVTYGEKLKISTPTCDWYEYAGLYQDEAKTVEFNLETIIKKDYNLYIKWAVANYDVNYIIPEDEGNNNEGNISEYNKDTNFTLLNATGKTGYTFDGWFLDSTYQTSISAINKTTITQSGAINIYAKFICNQAILSKKSSGKVEGNNASFFVKAAADTYSIFDYFDCSKRSTTVLKDSGDNVITNITLAANEDEENNVLHNFTIIITAEDGVTTNTYNLVVTQFSINGVVVTYYMDGDVYDSDEYAKGDNLVLQAAPSDVKDHYEFAYWSTSDVTPTEAVNGQTLTDNLNLYAYLTPVQYNIIYHLGLGVNHPNNPDKYEYSEDTALDLENALPNPNISMTFAGWFNALEQEVFSIAAQTSGTVELYAHFDTDVDPVWANALHEYAIQKDGITNENPFTMTITRAEYNSLLNFCLLNDILVFKAIISDVPSPINSEEDAKAVYNSLDSTTYVGLGCSISAKYSYTISTTNFNITPTITPQQLGGTSSSQARLTKYNYQHIVEAESNNNELENALDLIDSTFSVTTGEQLYYYVSHGYNVLPREGTTAETVYNTCKNVLKQIIDNSMTDRDKIVAIAQWMIDNITYAYDVANMNATSAEKMAYNVFFLEGVFIDRKAVCEGISKAVTVLCMMEGIYCYDVTGDHDGVGHEWNKAYIDVDLDGDKEWVSFDITQCNIGLSNDGAIGSELVSYYKLFVDDAVLLGSGYSFDDKFYTNTPKTIANIKDRSESNFDIYKEYKYEVDEQEYDYYIETQSELVALFKHCQSAFKASKNTLNFETTSAFKASMDIFAAATAAGISITNVSSTNSTLTNASATETKYYVNIIFNLG